MTSFSAMTQFTGTSILAPVGLTPTKKLAVAPLVIGGVAAGGAAIIIESVLATGIVVVGTYVAYKVTEAISDAMVDAMASFGKRHVLSKLAHLRDAVMQAYEDGRRKFGAGSEKTYAHMQKLVTDWVNKPVGAPVVPNQPQIATRPTPAVAPIATLAPTISNNVALAKRIESGDANAYKLYESIRQLDNWLTSGKGEGIGSGRVATGQQLMALFKNMKVGAPLDLAISVDGTLLNFKVAKTERGGLAVTYGAQTYHVEIKGKGLDFSDTTKLVEAVLTRNNLFGRGNASAAEIRHDADYFMGIPSSKLKVKLSNGVTSRFSADLPKNHGTVTPIWIQESTGKFSYSPKAESAGWTPYLATVDNDNAGLASPEPGGALVLVRKSKWPKPPKLPKDPNTWTFILIAVGTVGSLWQAHKHHVENKLDSKKTRDSIEQAEINRIRAQQDDKYQTANVATAMADWPRPKVFRDNIAKANALLDMTMHYITEGEKLMVNNSVVDGKVKGDGVFLASYRAYKNAFLADMRAIVEDVKAAKTPEEAATAMRSLAAAAGTFRPPSLPVDENNSLYASNRNKPNITLNAITSSILNAVATKTIGIGTGRQITGNPPSAYDAIKAFGEATKTTGEQTPAPVDPGNKSRPDLIKQRSEIHQQLKTQLKAAGLAHLKITFSSASLAPTMFTQAMFISDRDLTSLQKLTTAKARVDDLIKRLYPIAEKQTSPLRDEMIKDAKGNPAGPNGSLSAISKELAQRIEALQNK